MSRDIKITFYDGEYWLHIDSSKKCKTLKEAEETFKKLVEMFEPTKSKI